VLSQSFSSQDGNIAGSDMALHDDDCRGLKPLHEMSTEKIKEF